MTGLPFRIAGTLAAPLVPFLLRRRRDRGKEDPERMSERCGIPGLPRPPGPLVWIHGASVGEAQSVLTLIQRLTALRPDITLLLTTGTVTSARLMGPRLPAGAIHQFAPVDTVAATRRFVDHWRPDLAIWIESELWPNLIGAMQRTGRPMVLLNARMSERSYRRWRRLPLLIRPLLQAFSHVAAQSPEAAERFRRLGATHVSRPGNLKHAAAPLDADAAQLSDLQHRLQDRPVWVAASIHPGEEPDLVAAHRKVLTQHPAALLVLVPRHPDRGAEIAGHFDRAGLQRATFSNGDLPAPDTQVYLADTMGCLGLYYRLANVAFIGGSFIPHGGQNLLEAARLGCFPLIGPHVENFADIVQSMTADGTACQVPDGSQLGAKVADLLSDPTVLTAACERAQHAVHDHDAVLDRVMSEIAPFLPVPVVAAPTLQEPAPQGPTP